MSVSFTQVCSCCGKDKELISTNYYRSKESPSGYHHECRECYVPKWKAREAGKDRDYFSVEGNIKSAKRLKEEERLVSYMMGLKTCSCCNVEKPLSSFYKNKVTKDKLTSWCIDCTKKRYLASVQDNVVKEQHDNRDSDSQVTREGQTSEV
jgi:hypothetical protein